MKKKFLYELDKNDEKVCERCKTIKHISMFYKDVTRPMGYSYICKDCGYKINKKYKHRSIWNKTHKESLYKAIKKWQDNNPLKVKAEKLMQQAINNGVLVRKPCEKCGNLKSHGHHPDYSKPLEVIWLCVRHHKQAHGYRFLSEV